MPGSLWQRLRPSARHPKPTDGEGDPEEQRIRAALLALRETTAREVMTPRVDVVALRAPVTYEDVARAVRESGHSRFPVYDEDLDHLVGILFVKDLFRMGDPPTPATIATPARMDARAWTKRTRQFGRVSAISRRKMRLGRIRRMLSRGGRVNKSAARIAIAMPWAAVIRSQRVDGSN